MPCLIRHLPLGEHTGASVPPDREVDGLSDAARYESSNGVYGVFATWNGHRVVCLSRHLDRLEDSAERAGFTLELNRALLRGQLWQLAQDSGFDEVKIRLSATPGAGVLMASVEPYTGPPSDLRKTGVRCATVHNLSRSNPLVKQTQWIHRRRELDDAAGDVYERLLVDSGGRILEGTSSNFSVICDAPARLRTAGGNILPGIARAIMLDVAAEVLAVDLEAPLASEMNSFHEAFITSASRGIVPVVEIDGHPVGSGSPGPITATLIERYSIHARTLEEPLKPTVEAR